MVVPARRGPMSSILFLHIRKTAGLSFRHFMANRFAADACLFDAHYRRSPPRNPADHEPAAPAGTGLPLDLEADVPAHLLRQSSGRVVLHFRPGQTMRVCDLDPRTPNASAGSGPQPRPARRLTKPGKLH